MSRRPHIHAKTLIISADLLSDAGNQLIGLLLLDVLVFKGENALFSLVAMCVIHQLPSIFLSLFAGAGIDRIGPKKWLILVNAVRAVLAGAFAFTVSIWAIFSVYLCFIIASLFFAIGRLSIVPLLVPKNELMGFNALNERIAIGGGILSPWLIGIILENTGKGPALCAAALIFAVSVLLVAKISMQEVPSPASPAGRTAGRPEKRGIHHRLLSGYKAPFKGNHPLLIYFFLLGFVLLGGGVLNLGLPLFFKTNFNGNIARWGFVMSAFQAGAFCGTLLLSRWADALQKGAIPSVSFLILGCAMFVLPYATSYLQLAALMALFGCGFTMLHLFWESLIQQYSPRHLLGKTMSLLSSYKGLCYLGTISAGAVISNIWGAKSFLMIGSVIVGSAFFMARK